MPPVSVATLVPTLVRPTDDPRDLDEFWGTGACTPVVRVSEARPDTLARRGPPRGRDLKATVAALAGSVLDRLLEAALRREFATVEAELRKRKRRAA